ncbi:hypothetical protein GCM10023175_32080 [Pseudonocardia xishanensis]|uniref:Transaldolase n=1 Tax=Pseudonocardia xishanensis TaxID=630995 RepID=A0ABP8RUJ2_9PSEU
MPPRDRLAELSSAGVSVRLTTSRERLRSGGLAALIRERSVVGVTTNPTVFATALARGEAYDQQVRELVAADTDVPAAIRAITVADVQQACDLFRGTWETSGGVDGRVPLEVDPTLADDTDADAVDLWRTVDRPNLASFFVSRVDGEIDRRLDALQAVGIDLTEVFPALERDVEG